MVNFFCDVKFGLWHTNAKHTHACAFTSLYYNNSHPIGDLQAFSTFQLVETISAEKWYEFSSAGQNYLAVASNAPTGQSTLYAWRGALLPIQVQ